MECVIVLTEILTEEQKKEELEKLYSAIGYSEGEVITAFPKEVDCIFSCIYMHSVQLNPDVLSHPFVTRSLVEMYSILIVQSG